MRVPRGEVPRRWSYDLVIGDFTILNVQPVSKGTAGSFDEPFSSPALRDFPLRNEMRTRVDGGNDVFHDYLGAREFKQSSDHARFHPTASVSDG